MTDAVTAAFVADCREASVDGAIPLKKMIEIFWTGGLADDLRAALEKEGKTHLMNPENYTAEIWAVFTGLSNTLSEHGIRVVR